ncbi:CpaF family protein [Nitriliruptor alkaliphilus]|uniref:CpaF family protein n=1 Tax=Nitriliruptor alkaliphilus TaxID=427918 RepID=UPI000697D6C3|nr:ATPase, T2SS/T4P/T4SS family [Nitriliruptor alkaliphilus]
MRRLLEQWSRPAVREIVTWALPPLERRLSDAVDDQQLRGDDLVERGAMWIAETVKDFRRQAVAGEVTALDVSEPTLAAAREALWAELFGLGRLQPLLDDPCVQDIHVNGHDRVFAVLDDGTREQLPAVADSDDALIERFQLVASRHGETPRSWDRANPTLDLQLRSGHRLSAVMVVSDRPSITIRRPTTTLHRLAELVAVGALSDELTRFLTAAVRARLNLVVAGGQGAGKTTLMRALLNEVPASERIVTAEDARELQLAEAIDANGQLLHPDLVSLETRSSNSEAAGLFTLADCLRLTKRMNPDRVVVGEVRDVEAEQMVDAMLGSTGGSMCTVHATSAHKAIGRLRALMIRTGQLGERAAMELLTDAVDLVIFQAQDPSSGARFVSEVAEVSMAEGQATFHDVFVPGSDGRATLRAGGLSHRLVQRLAPYGFVPASASNGQVIR